MASERTITITVPSDVAERMQSAVERGEFASQGDLVRAALDQWSAHGAHEPPVEDLRRLWHEGLDSGPGRFANADDIKAEGRRRLASS
ncbi:MAG: type toxin-antitoxin system ParD family antitoxin [Tardiphaga sp.]|nr:type toxin-antitoxin system ParD family antitoxin [Hyphomicrobiales bacterium]MDB5626969.1 type toxin-antitoxin system ParD family antitoxin [Tardiphaga sp.]